MNKEITKQKLQVVFSSDLKLRCLLYMYHNVDRGGGIKNDIQETTAVHRNDCAFLIVLRKKSHFRAKSKFDSEIVIFLEFKVITIRFSSAKMKSRLMNHRLNFLVFRYSCFSMEKWILFKCGFIKSLTCGFLADDARQ